MQTVDGKFERHVCHGSRFRKLGRRRYSVNSTRRYGQRVNTVASEWLRDSRSFEDLSDTLYGVPSRSIHFRSDEGHGDTSDLLGISSRYLHRTDTDRCSKRLARPKPSYKQTILYSRCFFRQRYPLVSAGFRSTRSLAIRPFVTTETGHRPCVTRVHRGCHKSSSN